MDENEFKKLASNSRDWMIYKKLEDLSSVTLKGEAFRKKEIESEHVSGIDLKKTVRNISGVSIEEQAKSSLQESVLMDLAEVTIIAETPKAILVLKKGYQKWVPISAVTGIHWMEKNTSRYFEKINLTPEGEKWIHEKPWVPFKVVKNRQ